MLDLRNVYKNKITNYLMKKLNFTSVMQVPKVVKITLNIGDGDCNGNKKNLNNIVSDITMISGQKPIVTNAKKSISGFKIRQGYPVGCKVTLRKNRMWDFINRFIYIVVPRIRDFRGFNKKSFDGMGNYSIGIKEQIIFPEINYEKVDKTRGLNITITTNTNIDLYSLELLKSLSFPFKK
ncbi:50S ribosomal protein L5 [Buchnera aphidicola (Chaitoregma tattakana)]|uniref:50S ribosomal protein L5 n=1 Tax=Buchnera aphidicola TaxID=9 RepID=UPI0031B859F1